MSHKEIIIWLSEYTSNSKIVDGSGNKFVKLSSTSSKNTSDMSYNLNCDVDSGSYWKIITSLWQSCI